MDDGVPSYIVWLFPVDAQGDFMAVFLQVTKLLYGWFWHTFFFQMTSILKITVIFMQIILLSLEKNRITHLFYSSFPEQIYLF